MYITLLLLFDTLTIFPRAVRLLLIILGLIGFILEVVRVRDAPLDHTTFSIDIFLYKTDSNSLETVAALNLVIYLLKFLVKSIWRKNKTLLLEANFLVALHQTE